MISVIIEDLCGNQVCGVSEALARRDAKDGWYEFVFGIHKLKIHVPPTVSSEPSALLPPI